MGSILSRCFKKPDNSCEHSCNPASNTFVSCDLDAFLKIYPFDLTSSQDSSSRTQKIRHILRNLRVLVGHGQPAADIKEAVATLMSRNYPEVLNWDGFSKLVVFVPDFYLNKATEYVNPEDGPKLLSDCEDLVSAETNPERRIHLKKHQNKFFEGKRTWKGEYPELNLYNALTKYAMEKNESLAVFHGLNLVKFEPDRNPGKYIHNKAEISFSLIVQDKYLKALHRLISFVFLKHSKTPILISFYTFAKKICQMTSFRCI